MNDEQLIRYSRQILLPNFGNEKQELLNQAKVTLVGLGGLGCPIALYLAAAGVGYLTLIDYDTVALENLQRQIAFSETSVGESKVNAIEKHLSLINNTIKIHAINEKLNANQFEQLIKTQDLIIDATDNFSTRFIINQVCYHLKKPLVSGAAIGWQGQISVFDFRVTGSPCYECLYPKESIEHSSGCAESGIIGPVVGIIGSMQALETIKLITHLGNPLTGKLLSFNGENNSWRESIIQQDSMCKICNKNNNSKKRHSSWNQKSFIKTG